MVQVRVVRIRHRGGLVRVIAGLGDQRAAFEKDAQALEDHFGRVFATQGAELGRGWQKLSPGYSLAKARSHAGHPILTREGAMRNSLAERSAPGHHERIGRQQMDYGSSISYLRAHHFGAPARNLPRREVVRTTGKVRARIIRHHRDQIRL
jgi:hypothetical protein